MEKQQNQQIPSSLSRRKSSAESCDICLEQYDIVRRWPMLACPNSHFFCDLCIANMFRYSNNEPCPCPICRAQIKQSGVKPHSVLFTTINVESKVEAALGEEKRQLFVYAFKYEIYDIAKTFKQGKKISELLSVDASYRNLLTIQHFEGFDRLQKLRMQGNRIKSLAGLQGLQGLRIINLSHNEIDDISPLRMLKKLQILAVQFNQLATVPSIQSFPALQHWFLWNRLKEDFVLDLVKANAHNLKTISISFDDKIREKAMYKLGMKAIQMNLIKLIFEDCLPQVAKDEIVAMLFEWNAQTKFSFVAQSDIKQHEQWLRLWLEQYQIYGSVFAFQPDSLNPCFKDYKIESNKITKQSSLFTIINSSQPIPKECRQNFKMRLEESSQHMVMGMCNAFVKHSPNVYSEHFVGITLWGMVYSRGEAKALQNKLRLDAHPVLRMCVDFQEETISWFCDEQEVAKVALPAPFKHSQLYFLLGMRDVDTAVVILDE